MARRVILLLRWLVLKVTQRVAARMHAGRVRWGEWLSLGRRSPAVECSVLPWGPLAAPPGVAKHLPWGNGFAPDAEGLVLAADVRAHRFKILSAVAQEVRIDDPLRSAAIAALARGLPKPAVDSYRPIDWHADFHSGYRWQPDELYIDVRVGPAVGADIKVPRELSRFQHVGALARGPLEEGGIEFLLQVLDWIVANPVRRGPNWACTMDIALRAVNWIWGLRLFEPVMMQYPAVMQLIAGSLRDHGQHIAANLEYYKDLTNNHYLSNVTGLVYIGACCPELPEADAWLAFGLQELVSEMERQVYDDGANQEASTHYHRLVADLFVSCASLAERVPMERRERLKLMDRGTWRHSPPLCPLASSGIALGSGQVLPPAFYAKLARMAEYTAALIKPNGLVPQIGDNDSARAHFLLPTADLDFRDHAHLPATVGELLDRADLRYLGASSTREAQLVAGDLRGRITPPPVRDLAAPTILFPDAGVAICKAGSAWLAITCGANGQGGRGGHNHNDKNGFELNVGGHDFIVDGGCPVYTAAPEIRNRYRSTAMHSTVSIEGEEQDRWTDGMAGLFRLRERSSPKLRVDPDGSVVGCHVGYGAPHRRRFRLSDDGLAIEDWLDDERVRWIAFNLDPAVAVERLDGAGEQVTGRLRHAASLVVDFVIDGVEAPELGPGAFGVGYGQPINNQRLRAKLVGKQAVTKFRWAV